MIIRRTPPRDAAEEAVEELASMLADSDMENLRRQGWKHYEVASRLMKLIDQRDRRRDK